jgi:3-deoxy-D-manno-octulosonic acid kinase
MVKSLEIPPSFSLVKKGKASLLLENEYRDVLLQGGIEDVEAYLVKHGAGMTYFRGRNAHPSIPLGSKERMVVRRYSHGGVFRFLTRDLYLLGSRSFRELALTREVSASGIPTIHPLGAVHQRIFPFFYRAYLLSLEIPNAKDLGQYYQEAGRHTNQMNLPRKRMIIREAGLTLRKFHDAGFFHADLQLKNLMVTDAEVVLIDFDRSFRKQTLSPQERVRNLLRLNRSAEKWKRRGLPITWADRWRFFRAYSAGDEEMTKVLRKALRGYSMRVFFHRILWSMGGVKGF